MIWESSLLLASSYSNYPYNFAILISEQKAWKIITITAFHDHQMAFHNGKFLNQAYPPARLTTVALKHYSMCLTSMWEELISIPQLWENTRLAVGSYRRARTEHTNVNHRRKSSPGVLKRLSCPIVYTQTDRWISLMHCLWFFALIFTILTHRRRQVRTRCWSLGFGSWT